MTGINNQAEVIDLVDVNEHSFTIPGNPPPMPRARTSKHFYNGNRISNKTAAFRAGTQRALPQTRQGVLFGVEDSISIAIMFYVLRPEKDFVSSNRTRLLQRLALARSAPPTGPDIDSLTKFVLDALTGLVYPDDHQLVKLAVCKV